MDTKALSFDVIVVGAGHAGAEAAYAAARLGADTLLLTLNMDRIGHMPCNPAVGGIGKGHIVDEIAACGGLMPQLCSTTYLQARMLNTRKGPAVRGLRLQIDKVAYAHACRQLLSTTPHLTISMGMVTELLYNTDKSAVIGVRTREGAVYYAKTIVVTTGTFLNGLIHTGQVNYPSGRQGEEAATTLSASLTQAGIKMGRLKTGTPPRLLRSSIDFSVMERQGSDELDYLFEFHPQKVVHKLDCYITHTNERTHEIIREHFHESPIFTGSITGKPPRYCPSIEDKISRFADKKSHHIFVEPESASHDEMYPNGLSTSLPLEVQRLFIQSIAGFEKAQIVRPGYAIEYDYAFPEQLAHTLEVRTVAGLFLAGQINGTTGYEEAAGQGLMAGINAARKALGKPAWVLSREESYIGIMIDDLVTLGADEPYRMFTSRAERRLLLRHDNVFARLGAAAYQLGLLSDDLFAEMERERILVADTCKAVRNARADKEIVILLYDGAYDAAHARIQAYAPGPLSSRALISVHAELLYEPYLVREAREIEKSITYRNLVIPAQFDYGIISGLSTELKQKLDRYRPATIAQAQLIQGMTPAAISLLIFRVREHIESNQHIGCGDTLCN